MEATIGGTRRHLVDLAGGQQARGHEVHLAVATARDPGFPADLERLEGLGVGKVRFRRGAQATSNAWTSAR
jgi:hypothetical protein